MTIFKPLGSQDKVSTKTLLHEAIPLTGTIVSGTYGEENIKNFAHGMFQSIYDYPFLSSSANHIFDITVGTSGDSILPVTSQIAKKDNIYNQMAQVLMGYDKDGNIQKFDQDGDLTAGDKLNEVFFLSFSRLLAKDEIHKGTFQLELGVDSDFNEEGTVFQKRIQITDASGSDGYLVNSPAGEYGILFATASYAQNPGNNPVLAENKSYPVGLLFYQAGVAVVTGSVFHDDAHPGGILNATHTDSSQMTRGNGYQGFDFVSGSEISASADAIRTRIYNIQFNNTVELNSTIHFCRINHNEFNYSGNPTYLSGSEIKVKQTKNDPPISYITSVGLYSADNQLLAVGKLSEPVRKDSNIELTFRARLDY